MIYANALVAQALATGEFRLTLELESYQLHKGEDKQIYEHVWKPPRPTSDAKFLCRLACLDLAEVTFEAPIKKAMVEVVPSRPRTTQGGLFQPASPEPEKLEITLARIRGVVGSVDNKGTACVGSPQVLDSYKPDSFSVQSFSSFATRFRSGIRFAAQPDPGLSDPIPNSRNRVPAIYLLWKQELRSAILMERGKPTRPADAVGTRTL